MSISKISRKIKNKVNPNDVFITPIDLAKLHISKITLNDNEVWYDPFKNNGSYYNQFKTENKLWSEILEGKDFFDFNEKIDIICSNPPYSMIDKVLEKSVSLNPRIISYLIGYGNITTKRLEYMELNGYKIVYFHLTKVYQWYGMSSIIIWEKNDSPSLIGFDRTVWK
jgi:hypothetical protein